MTWSNKTKKRVRHLNKKNIFNDQRSKKRVRHLSKKNIFNDQKYKKHKSNKRKYLYRGVKNKGVGNVNCNIAIKDNVPGSCLTSEMIDSLKKKYTQINDTDPLEVLQKIMESKQCKDERCVIEDKEIIDQRYAPEHPRSWLKNPDEWLTNKDIDNFLDDVEKKYSDFEALRTTPIDFDKRIWGQCVERELCDFSLKNNLDKGKKRFGTVFNLDKHDEPGSHWVSLFISVDDKAIIFFDSAYGGVPEEIKSFVERIQDQAKSLNINLVFRTNEVEHQKSNTECGMYSIYFIIEMLKDFKNLETFMNGNISDNVVFKKRDEYFNDPLT